MWKAQEVRDKNISERHTEKPMEGEGMKDGEKDATERAPEYCKRRGIVFWGQGDWEFRDVPRCRSARDASLPPGVDTGPARLLADLTRHAPYFVAVTHSVNMAGPSRDERYELDYLMRHANDGRERGACLCAANDVTELLVSPVRQACGDEDDKHDYRGPLIVQKWLCDLRMDCTEADVRFLAEKLKKLRSRSSHP